VAKSDAHAQGVGSSRTKRPEGYCQRRRHRDEDGVTMSPLVLCTMANNSLCSASGTLNFTIVSSKSLQKAA
jgi:hypothetical protein